MAQLPNVRQGRPEKRPPCPHMAIFSCISDFRCEKEMVTRAKVVSIDHSKPCWSIVQSNPSRWVKQEIGCFGAVQQTGGLVSTALMQDAKATKSKTWPAAQSWDDMPRDISIGYQTRRTARQAYQKCSHTERSMDLVSAAQASLRRADQFCQVQGMGERKAAVCRNLA